MDPVVERYFVGPIDCPAHTIFSLAEIRWLALFFVVLRINRFTSGLVIAVELGIEQQKSEIIVDVALSIQTDNK